MKTDEKYKYYVVRDEMDCSEEQFDEYREAYRHALNIQGVLIGINKYSREEVLEDFSDNW